MEIHRPPHLYLDNQVYFITGTTFRHYFFMETDFKKRLILATLFSVAARNNICLYAWVIMSTHYHLLIRVSAAESLPRFVRTFHSKVALALNVIDHKKNRRVFYQYWDTCVRTETDFWKRVNYIHHNCIKHGVAERMESYPFSSYLHFQKTYGQELLDSYFEYYPIIDYFKTN